MRLIRASTTEDAGDSVNSGLVSLPMIRRTILPRIVMKRSRPVSGVSGTLIPASSLRSSVLDKASDTNSSTFVIFAVILSLTSANKFSSCLVAGLEGKRSSRNVAACTISCRTVSVVISKPLEMLIMFSLGL